MTWIQMKIYFSITECLQSVKNINNLVHIDELETPNSSKTVYHTLKM